MKLVSLFLALLCGAIAQNDISGLFASATDTTTALVYVPQITVSNQEASDVVKAMEIFSIPEPDCMPTQVYSTNAVVIDAGMLMMGDTESPDGLRRRADWLEKLAKLREQRRSDLDWARTVLRKWKALLDKNH